MLLRPGGISAADLEAALGVPLAASDAVAPRVSGDLATHYAPRTPARRLDAAGLAAAIAQFGNRAAVLAFSVPDERVDYWLRMPREPGAYARKLYAALRELDSTQSEILLIESPPDLPEWRAVLDRLGRAAQD